MVDIPVQRRQSVPSWAWVVLGLIVVLVVLALIDYFVTNLVFNQAVGATPARTDGRFEASFGTMVLLVSGFLPSITSRL